MKIFKDAITGDELFSDTYKMELRDGMYEVTGKYETRMGDTVVLAGANASAEEADEGTDEGTTSGIDVILNHNLVPTQFADKKAYAAELKTYVKKIMGHLKEIGKEDDLVDFKAACAKLGVLEKGKFKDYEFYMGESMTGEGMVVLLKYEEVDGEEKPIFMFFKHGLIEEKC